MTTLTYQQRLYPTLHIESTAMVRNGRSQPGRLHCRQGEWDGACGLYCAAMALTLLGRINSSRNLASRRNGMAGALWRIGRDDYFEGFHGTELARLIRAVDHKLFVRSCRGAHLRLRNLVQRQLDLGRLAIIGWESRNGQISHWVLAVGMEGMQRSDKFQPRTILCLDPSGPEPVLCGYNGRLELNDNPDSYGETYIRYLASDGSVTPVTLSDVVMLGKN